MNNQNNGWGNNNGWQQPNNSGQQQQTNNGWQQPNNGGQQHNNGGRQQPNNGNQQPNNGNNWGNQYGQPRQNNQPQNNWNNQNQGMNTGWNASQQSQNYTNAWENQNRGWENQSKKGLPGWALGCIIGGAVVILLLIVGLIFGSPKTPDGPDTDDLNSGYSDGTEQDDPIIQGDTFSFENALTRYIIAADGFEEMLDNGIIKQFKLDSATVYSLDDLKDEGFIDTTYSNPESKGCLVVHGKLMLNEYGSAFAQIAGEENTEYIEVNTAIDIHVNADNRIEYTKLEHTDSTIKSTPIESLDLSSTQAELDEVIKEDIEKSKKFIRESVEKSLDWSILGTDKSILENYLITLGKAEWAEFKDTIKLMEMSKVKLVMGSDMKDLLAGKLDAASESMISKGLEPMSLWMIFELTAHVTGGSDSAWFGCYLSLNDIANGDLGSNALSRFLSFKNTGINFTDSTLKSFKEIDPSYINNQFKLIADSSSQGGASTNSSFVYGKYTMDPSKASENWEWVAVDAVLSTLNALFEDESSRTYNNAFGLSNLYTLSIMQCTPDQFNKWLTECGVATMDLTGWENVYVLKVNMSQSTEDFKFIMMFALNSKEYSNPYALNIDTDAMFSLDGKSLSSQWFSDELREFLKANK